MPELPEVETTRRGITPYILNRRMTGAVVREARLRWPVPANLGEILRGQSVRQIERRGKYLLLQTEAGCVILHLGMSGSLKIVPLNTPPQKHEHVDVCFTGGTALRLRDPRRFGALLWTKQPVASHPLLVHLGPEPLGKAFTGKYLWERARGKRVSVKAMLMDARIVVGVGNIYANESLFRAGIDPRRSAGRIAKARYTRLVECIREVLIEAIEAGGTTLRDFVREDGSPGYFRLTHKVYGRSGQPCLNCGESVREVSLAQRSTFFCINCQR